MSLNVKLESPKILKSILESISSNLTEGIFLEFQESGLQIHINISGGIWAVESKISKDMFSVYELDKSQVLQLRYKDLTDFIKTTGAQDSLVIQSGDTEGNVSLKLSKEHTERSMKLGLLDYSDYEFKNFFQFTNKYKGKFTISTSLYNEAVKTVELGGSHVKFTMSKDKISLQSKAGSKNAEVEITSDNDDVQNFSYEYDSESVTSHFGIEYLANIAKFSKISDSMLVCVGDRMPILCIFQNPDVDFVAIAVAPRNE